MDRRFLGAVEDKFSTENQSKNTAGFNDAPTGYKEVFEIVDFGADGQILRYDDSDLNQTNLDV